MHAYAENYEERQKTWQKEVVEKLQTVANNSTNVYEFEKDLIRKRQDEWKHAKDVRLIYERKLERTNILYQELSACFVQLEEREREISEREKQLGTSKPYKKAISQLKKQHFDKINRKKLYIQPTTTASEVNSAGTSPSPPTSPIAKASLCVQIDGSSTKTILHQPTSNGQCFPPPPKYIPRKVRHRRTGSGSSISKITTPDRREVKLIHSETQTEDINKIAGEKSPVVTPIMTPRTKEVTFKHSKAILQSSESSSDGDIDDHAPEDDTTSSSQNNPNHVMTNSMATSVMTCSNFSFDGPYPKEDECSDDDLESLRQKVNNLITDTSNSTTSSASTIINKAYATRSSSEMFTSKYDENMNDDKNDISDMHDAEISTDENKYALNTKEISNFLRRKR
jgi:mitogen-activated protein kinase kinase kinase 13